MFTERSLVGNQVSTTRLARDQLSNKGQEHNLGRDNRSRGDARSVLKVCFEK
jgi:hypothetical protein